jgi:class 3 adenylate cyclase
MREEAAGAPTPAPAVAGRIGIDTGPVVAGVIGRSKFSYDRWATPATPPAASRPTVPGASR